MQAKLYAVQVSHYPMTNLQTVPEQQLRNPENMNYMNFAKLQKIPKHPAKRGFELTGKKNSRVSPPANPRL